MRKTRKKTRNSRKIVSLLATVILVFLLGFGPSDSAQRAGISSPEWVLGSKIRDGYNLASYDASIGYFRRFKSASDTMQLFDIDHTSKGQNRYVTLISSPENLAKCQEKDKEKKKQNHQARTR